MASNGQVPVSCSVLDSVTYRRIPYLPMLRSHCGNSILASLLMQQLEYWFRDRPQGFYKFLSPCDHSRYKSGDSWIEELAISAHEFRAAFGKIGCRYKSKKQWQLVIEHEKDPFQNRYYCSYLDIRSGLTYYLRHPYRVDQLVQTVLQHNTASSKQQLSDLSGDAKCASPEMNILHFHRLKKWISGSEKNASPIKETKMNNKEDTEKTAALSDQKTSKGKPTQPSAGIAAAMDNVIGESLTSSQTAHLQVVVEGLLSYLPTLDATTLMQGIEHSLCDRNAYSRAGSDFFKKLNTIQKAIREGKWSMPAVITEKKEFAYQNQRAQLQQKWRELQGECDHLKKLATSMKHKGNSHIEKKLRQQINYCCDRIHQVKIALLEVQDKR